MELGEWGSGDWSQPECSVTSSWVVSEGKTQSRQKRRWRPRKQMEMVPPGPGSVLTRPEGTPGFRRHSTRIFPGTKIDEIHEARRGYLPPCRLWLAYPALPLGAGKTHIPLSSSSRPGHPGEGVCCSAG